MPQDLTCGIFIMGVSYTIKCNSLKIKIEVHVNLW